MIKKILVAVIMVFSFNTAFAGWLDLSLDDRAEILGELPYLSQEKLPENTKAISLKRQKNFELSQIHYKPYRDFVEKMIKTFDDEVDTEELEQTEMIVFGEPRVEQVYILVNADKKILGGYIYKFQEGRDPERPDDDSVDVSWGASIRVDEKAQLYRNENGYEYDDLYYEWSGW